MSLVSLVMSYTSASFLLESNEYIFMVSKSMIVVRVVSPVTMSLLIWEPLMNVVVAIVPPIPRPLPAVEAFMVMSANAGAASAMKQTALKIERFMSVISLFYCCCVEVDRGLAFLAHSFAQFS